MNEESCAERRQVGDVELFRAAVKLVGMQRLLVLAGWCTYWAATGNPNPKELRLKLQASGMVRASAYRVLEDLKRIGDMWRELEQQPARSPWETAQKLTNLSL